MAGRAARSEQYGWWRFAEAVVGVVFRLGLRIRVAGERNLPRSGSALVAANHVSFLDPVVLGLVISRRGRIIRFMGAAEFFSRPFWGWALRTLHQIPVRRGGGGGEALQETVNTIRGGTLAGIFPEGRLRKPGEDLLPGHRGVARLALAAGVPVIPAAVAGTDLRWPQTGFRWRPLRPKVAVVFGPPIQSQGDPGSRSDTRALLDQIMAAIRELEAQARIRARS